MIPGNIPISTGTSILKRITQVALEIFIRQDGWKCEDFIFAAEIQNPEDVNLMTVNVPQQDCMVRQNFVPREAQRLQHGSIRVLKDLTGYHIKGLLGGNSFRQDVTKKGSFSEKLGKHSQQKNDWKLSQQKRLTGETFPTKTMDLKGPETLSFFQDTARFGEGLRQQRRFLPASRIAKPQRFLLVDALPCKDGGLLHHSLYR